MKSLSIIFAVVLLMVGFQGVQAAQTNWDAFSANLTLAVQSDNAGVQQSALRQIIYYEGKLNMKEAIFDIVSIFRNNADTKVRHLALVALYKTQDPWAMDFLKRHLEFEGDETIHKLNLNVIKDYIDRNTKMNIANKQAAM